MLKVATLNMNTGHGPRGHFREAIDKRALEENLARIADALAAESPDVVCLQEVDFDWRGTHGIDQAKWIAWRARYPFVHGCAHHKSPLPHAVRRVLRNDVLFTRDCGTAILSRRPLLETRQYTFGQTLTPSSRMNYFARLLNESKGYTFARVDLDGTNVGILNVHLLNDIVFEILRVVGKQVRGEIFARAWQVEKLLEHVREHVERGTPVIVAGDFNSVPREDVLDHLHSRNGDPDDYRRDVSMVLVREAKLLATIPELFGQGTEATIEPYHTYPAVDPDRTLDYVFATGALSFVSYRVLGTPVSDHLGVVAELALRDVATARPREVTQRSEIDQTGRAECRDAPAEVRDRQQRRAP